jgi:hypothetical protein
MAGKDNTTQSDTEFSVISFAMMPNGRMTDEVEKV